MKRMTQLRIFRAILLKKQARTYPEFEGDPLDHPELRGLGPRELADLPMPRHKAI